MTNLSCYEEIEHVVTVAYNCHFSLALYEHLKKLNKAVGQDFMDIILDEDVYYQSTYRKVSNAVDFFCSEVCGINFDGIELSEFIDNALEMSAPEFEFLQQQAEEDEVWNNTQLKLFT